MKPKVICHIMSSVDGRLLPGRWTQPFDGTNPAELFGEYAAIGRSLGTDAWMFGKATTAEVFPINTYRLATVILRRARSISPAAIRRGCS